MRFIYVLLGLLLAFCLGCESDSTVAITRPVNDYANVLNSADEARLTERLVATRNTTGVQIALLVVSTTDGTPIDDYALAVMRRWGGGSATRNDGILVTFAVADRKSDVETGPGVQDRVPDVVAKRILDGARPAMRAHRYADAFDGVLAELDARVREGAPITSTAPAFHLPTVAHNAAPASDGTDGLFVFVFILVGFCGTIGGVMLYRRDARKRALRDEEDADAAEFERNRREQLARENARFAERAAQEARARVATKPSPSVPAPTQQAPAYTPPVSTYNRTPEPPRERGRMNYAASAPSAPASDTGYSTRRTRVSTPPQPYVAPAYAPSYEAPVSHYRSPTPVSTYRSPSPAFGSSSSSSWGSDSSSSSSSDSSSSSTDWGGGGGSSDGGGASSDW